MDSQPFFALSERETTSSGDPTSEVVLLRRGPVGYRPSAGEYVGSTVAVDEGSPRLASWRTR